ncbi:MAG: hypothetical protein KKG47_03730 [Proteobacteria bacterium]|nr:hypothetical protein [Pseudomonadota bacterium]MBU1738914.1 hypothetical protein [Pseudomonadota bacterium]
MMLLKVALGPPGEEGGRILDGWRKDWGLSRHADGRFRLPGHDPLAVIIDLRNRCYNHEITVEMAFGDEQVKQGS